ncbi:VCBS repeat-containing protein [Pontibacter sp. G13]|uniref:FG-GAP repeat domain-containing protein n=1 Tax=Pontibacter sp. G13 TaxID=3074898 RepID=UPI00288B73DC|nr:VCBS repeat-containing protein [Pontibacter sp. G13]WNJ20568.1 VCBS repeat-containing protein [Pontibacter sp. G13]
MSITKYTRSLASTGIVLCVLCLGGALWMGVAKDSIPLFYFVEMSADFPTEDKTLKKWDRALVADLDQDDYPDLILNDHGFGVRICWNNHGKFSKPYDLIMGDLHGVAVGDVDQDGQLELFISRGGGAGSNSRNAKVFRALGNRTFEEAPELSAGLPGMRGRTMKLVDADGDGDLDLINFAFHSKGFYGKSENFIYERTAEGTFELADTLPPVKGDGQKTLITDFNGDGTLDLILHGNGPLKAFQGNGELSFEDVSETLFADPILHASNVVEFDYDNDGDFDLFITRGKGFEVGETFYDSKTQTWGFFSMRGEFQPQDLQVGDVLKLENYFTTWPHTTIRLGESGYEYEFPGETHSGKDLRFVNSDALGFVDETTERGTYLGYVGNDAWRLSVDTWAPATGVVHGVKSYPEYEHPAGMTNVLLENRKGRYVDVSEQMGFTAIEHCTGVSVADFDNDGFMDLVVQRRGDLIHELESWIYLNEQGKGFRQMELTGLKSEELAASGSAVATLDYNLDGHQDVVLGNERGKWHLFQNRTSQSSENHFLTLKLDHSPEKAGTSLGAVISIEACGNQQWRRVGYAGAAYGHGANQWVHVGLGSCEGPIKVKVRYTNGTETTHTIQEVDTVVSLVPANAQ